MTSTRPLRVFRMDDYQWIAHYSEEEALDFYHEQTGVDMDDLVEAMLGWGEVPLSDTMFWDKADISDEEAQKENFDHVPDSPFGDCYSVPFEWVLRRFSDKYPGYIACTEG